jgi:hypothetical protein
MIKLIYLFLLLISISSIATAEPKWVQKPVQCATPQELITILDELGSKPLLGGISIITQDAVNFVGVPLIVYYHLESNEFQIIELHTANVACLIASGNEISFKSKKIEDDINKNFIK